jgi:hypothetical protein
MFISHEQNAGENCNTQQNKSYGTVAKFTHFGKTLKIKVAFVKKLRAD